MLAYILGITKWGSKGITNRIRFYWLQIGERGITNEGSLRDFKSEKKFTNWGRDLILGQRDFKSKLKLQIMSREYMPGKGLQISAEHGFFNLLINSFHVAGLVSFYTPWKKKTPGFQGI